VRILILCTHNSARSQIGEGWLRYYAQQMNLNAEIWSAGTEKSQVKPEAVEVMKEIGIDLSGHSSKTLWEVPDPWDFDVVVTVCHSANDTCPAYPAKTTRLHVSFPDPSGKSLDEWRRVRDALGRMCKRLVGKLSEGQIPGELELSNAARIGE